MMVHFLAQNEECLVLRTEAIIIHMLLIQEILAQKGKHKSVTVMVMHYFKKVMKLIYLTRLFVYLINSILINLLSKNYFKAMSYCVQ